MHVYEARGTIVYGCGQNDFLCAATLVTKLQRFTHFNYRVNHFPKLVLLVVIPQYQCLMLHSVRHPL